MTLTMFDVYQYIICVSVSEVLDSMTHAVVHSLVFIGRYACMWGMYAGRSVVGSQAHQLLDGVNLVYA